MQPTRRRLDGASPTTPSMADGTTLQSGGFRGRSINFDITIVAILAVLLSLLIIALIVNFIIRYVRRQRRQQASEALKKHALHQIPVAVYGPKANIPTTDCPICIGEFVDGDKVRVLPTCHHGFHVKCIDTWLMEHSSCPLCRHSLVDREVKPDQGEALTPTVVVDGDG